MTKLNQIEGLETKLVQALATLSIKTLEDLLDAAGAIAERTALAAEVRVTVRTITRWVTIADLSRVNGIHIKYAKLLQKARIKSVQDLAHANPQLLHDQLEMVNRMGCKQVDRVPAVSRVEKWIDDAQMTSIRMEIKSEILVQV